MKQVVREGESQKIDGEVNKRQQILAARTAQGQLCVQWGDGHTSGFHYLWLRDNCRCVACGERAVGQKLSLLVDTKADDSPASVAVQADGELKVVWASDAHESGYLPAWLREHCYSDVERAARRHRPTLWDRGLESELPQTDYARCFRDERGQHDLLCKIRDFGFAIVHDVPPDREHFQRMAERVGYIRETNYGRISDLVATEVPRTLSNTKHAIALHTDECYRSANPGLLAFQCLSASADGKGETLLADGFQIAQRLRAESPDAFDLLTRVSVSSRRFHPDEADLHAASPVISVDFEGRIQGVRYNERSAAPLDLPAALVEPAYAALRAWLTLTANPELQVRVLLRPGDFVVFDNQRILHGRNDFSGHRHLLYCQLDLDEVHSRARVLGARLGDRNAGLVMHRGT